MKNLLLLISLVGVTFISNAQCSAGASAVVTGNPANPGEVEFTNQCTGSSGSIITVTYGNGNVGTFTQNNFFTTWMYTYTQPGAYQYCITIYDSINSCTDTWCDSIYITSVSAFCDAYFSADSVSSYLDWAFNTSGNISTVPIDHYWDFGDGTNSTLANPNHTYSAPGSYVVCHTVTDTGGQCTSTLCDSVNAYPYTPPPPTPCSASFYWYQDSSTTQTVIVINNSIGVNGNNNNVSYLWDFGDGTSSTQAYPTHVYSSLGVFNVCLTITDMSNPILGPCTSVYCDSVWVTFKSAGFTLNVYPPEVAEVISISESLGIKVYPNPVSEILNIEVDKGEYPLNYTVNDINGKVILSGTQLSSDHSLDLGELESGIYLFHVQGYGVIRIIKK